MDMQWIHKLVREANEKCTSDADRLMHIAHPLANGIDSAIKALCEHLKSAGCDDGFVDSAHLEMTVSLLIHQVRTMIQQGSNGVIDEKKGREIGVELRDKVHDAIAGAFQKNLSDYRLATYDKRVK